MASIVDRPAVKPDCWGLRHLSIEAECALEGYVQILFPIQTQEKSACSYCTQTATLCLVEWDDNALLSYFHSAGTLPVDHTLVMTLWKALLIGFSAPFRSSAVMQRVKIPSQKCHIWNRRPWFAYSLCNFYGATMMIKDSLLLSAPLSSIFRGKN